MLEVVLDHPEDLMAFRQTWDAACRNPKDGSSRATLDTA
jgi:hypothetical protein